MIHSKFKIGYIFWFLFMLIVSSGIIWLFLSAVQDLIFLEANLTTFLIGLLFLFLTIFAIVVLKEFKYVVVNEKARELKWFSILAPFGKKILLTNYVGIMKHREYTAYEEITSIYFIDKNWTTAGKINGQFYSNFDEILSAIHLKEVRNKNHGFINYFKILFGGRVKIKR